ncbi:hypothetical protein GCM10027046_26260 [Uliginosibacterium flavum]|uniref:Outer-membrane lipoprotein LolB n=1 Tax=Uliginosibacterium flavum TaxID=1396831 RepID=A0ABV2TK18_9RHOO
MKSFYRIFSTALLCVLLAACSPQAAKQDLPARPQRESIQRFSLEARIAIRQPGSSNTIRMNWEHAHNTDLIGFAGPLGNQLAELQRDSLGARWISADGERQEARDADQLLARLTDTPLPLDSLALWALGRVSDRAENVQRDPDNRLLLATDMGWTLRISRYENDTPNALPAMLEIEHDTLRIRLAIEAWQL